MRLRKAVRPIRKTSTGNPAAVLESLEPKRLFATYYVSTIGWDANPGTADRPFASIKQAAYFTKPGDTVLVRGGTYHVTQQIWIGANGTKSKPITFKPFKNEKVVLDGSWMPANTDLVSIGGDYITFQDFTVQNSKQIGVIVLDATGVKIVDNHLTHNGWLGIAGWGSAKGSYRDVVVAGNTVDNNGAAHFNEAAAQWSPGVSLKFCDNALIRDNDVFNNWGEGIALTQDGEGSTIEDNRVHDNWSCDIYLMDQSGAIVRNNFTYSEGDKAFYRFNAPARSVQIANETWGAATKGGYRNQVINNVAVGNSFGFFYGNYDVGGGMHDTTIANNTWVNCTDGTLWIDKDTHANTTIKNNVISQNAKKAYVFYTKQSGITFASNLWYGNGTLVAAAKSNTDLFTDPKFVKRGRFVASDYRLQTNSTAINRGSKVSFAIDYSLKKRTLGKGVDLGAFEIR